MGDARGDRGRGGPLHRPCPRRGGHGLPVRARDLDQNPRDKFDTIDLDLLLKAAAPLAGRFADVGWNSPYCNNHDQPRAVSRSATTTPTWQASAKALGTIRTVCGDAVRLPGGADDELPVRSGSITGTSRRSTTTPTWSPAACTRTRRWRDRLDEPRQRAHPDAVGRLGGGRLHRRDAVATPVNPNHHLAQRGCPGRRPSSVFAHYRALIRLRHDSVLADGSVEPSSRTTRRSGPTGAAPRRSGCWWSPTADVSHATYPRGVVRRGAGAGQPAGTPTTYDAGATTFAPWDARIYLLRDDRRRSAVGTQSQVSEQAR